VGEPWATFTMNAPHSPRTVGLLQELFRKEQDAGRRRALLDALRVQTQPDLRPFWLGLLNDPKAPPDWEWLIVSGLGHTGTEEDLLTLTRRGGMAVYSETALLSALGARKSRAALPYARSRYGDLRADRGVRYTAFNTLAAIGNDLNRLLSEGLGDPDASIRREAARLLANHPRALADPAVRRRLRSSDPRTRHDVLETLRDRAEPGDFKALVQLLHDSEEDVRAAAEQALLTGYTGALARPTHFRDPLDLLAERPASGLDHSPRLLLQLADTAEREVELPRAERLYRRALAADQQRRTKPDEDFDSGANACYRLARLLQIQNRRDEALLAARELRRVYGARRVTGGEYGGGIANAAPGGKVAGWLEQQLSTTPLALEVTPLQAAFRPNEPLRLRVSLRNTSSVPQRIWFNRSRDGALLPSVQPTVTLNQRWSSPPPNEGGAAQPTSLAPGERFTEELRVDSSGAPSGRLRLDLTVQVTTHGAGPKPWTGTLQAVTRIDHGAGQTAPPPG
ncbi:MAG TPA: HEAT repeat domain-containing protein, partial [Armatimonadota bacterium]|nr:HEAT repeat domain-containing protein [Armatimonadota bacterium]